ncbi:MAG: symmetrical bis(5'-nucleosyl)-tetraphosphatase [Burkholderiales bacterium]
MALYCIGDVQGCNDALGRLLAELDFSPSRDTLYLLGDLVNRGPDNVGVLRRLMALSAAAQCLLGNHDLHLLAVAHGVRPQQPRDTLDDVLQAPDRVALLDWLRQQRLAMQPTGAGVLMVHAGLLPGWSATQALALAAEVETELQGPQLVAFLRTMYGNSPAQWRDDLQGTERLRVIVNALTRLRFCSPDGTMDFKVKEGANAQAGSQPPGLLPWFDVPGRASAGTTVAFGHWSTLGWLGRHDVLCLDSGCVWGGCLTAVELPAQPARQAAGEPWCRLTVKCATAAAP